MPMVHTHRPHLQELGSRFIAKPEERLLSVVTALLHRCYKVWI